MRRFVCCIVGNKEGGSRWSVDVEKLSYQAGAAAAKQGFVVLTGGKSGVMSAAAQGAMEAGGTTIGVLPEADRSMANPYLSLSLPTGMGIARNALTAMFCDVMIAMPGGSGTLEEMAFATDFGRPVLSLGSWNVPGLEGVKQVADLHELSTLLGEIYAELVRQEMNK